jgi:hypothetical protein
LDGDRGQVVRPYSRIFRRASLARLPSGAAARSRASDPTIAQKLVVQRICAMQARLDAFGDKLKTGAWTELDMPIYGGFERL